MDKILMKSDLEIELGLYYYTDSKFKHHGCKDGLDALQMMREEITNKFFRSEHIDLNAAYEAFDLNYDLFVVNQL